jgi:uncharacterized phage protein (TIGR02218 family)
VKTFSSALQAHLDGGATTLAWCWMLTLASGEVMGFTDHDRDLTFGGLTYAAQSGFTASEMEGALGFATANLDVAGALDDQRLSEVRLRAGDFDGAAFEIWLVNWQDVSQRTIVRKGALGEVGHGELGFTAELRGLAHLLNQPQGRVFQYACDAVVGDQRCGVDLTLPAYRGSGAVLSAREDRVLLVDGLAAFAASWFAGGVLTWIAGANSGRRAAVKFHRVSGSQVTLELWHAMAVPVATGDGFWVTAGCDRQFSTCRAKFANGLNFRGFPHMPGNDFVTSYPNRDDGANDGGSRHA